MSCFKDGEYFALISYPTQNKKWLIGFEKSPTKFEVFTFVFTMFGIKGTNYLISAEENAIIANDAALRYALKNNHTIILSESGELCSDKEKNMDSDLGLTTAERKALKLFLKSFMKSQDTSGTASV